MRTRALFKKFWLYGIPILCIGIAGLIYWFGWLPANDPWRFVTPFAMAAILGVILWQSRLREIRLKGRATPNASELLRYSLAVTLGLLTLPISRFDIHKMAGFASVLCMLAWLPQSIIIIGRETETSRERA